MHIFERTRENNKLSYSASRLSFLTRGREMHIGGLEYNTNHLALEIYFSGCTPPHCPGCHNEILWDFSFGFRVETIMNEIDRLLMNDMVEYVWLLGGEPQDQDPEEFSSFVQWIASYGKPLILFTRYAALYPCFYGLPISYIKTGWYERDLPSYVEPVLGITLASSNQKVVENKWK